MFTNVVVASSGSTISVRWNWNYTPESTVLPSCSLFYCALPENQLLDLGLFLENEILEHFEKKVLGFDSTDARRAMELYNVAHSETSRLITCDLRDGDSIVKEISIPVTAKQCDHVFYVCVYDDKKLHSRIVSVASGTSVDFEIKQASFFHPYHTLIIKAVDSRKKVIVTKQGGKYAYSVLPAGQTEFYYDKQMDIESIDVQYLSMLFVPNE
jgi:hypothetical protein